MSAQKVFLPKDVDSILEEILVLRNKIDKMKAIYKQLDEKTDQLVNLIGEGQEVFVSERILFDENNVPVVVSSQFIKIVDNFKSTNVVFKSVPCRSFELSVQTETERTAK